MNQLCQQRRDGAQCEAVLWDLAGGETLAVLDHGKAVVNAVATIEAGGRTLIVTGATDGLRVWDSHGRLVTHRDDVGRVQALACGHRDDTPVVVAGHGREVHVWEVDGMAVRQHFVFPQDVRAVAVEPGGDIAIGFDSDVGVWSRGAR